MTDPFSLVKRLVDLGFDASPTQRKGQFTPTPVRQHRMKQTVGRQDGAADQSEVIPKGLIGWIVMDHRVTHWVQSVFVDPGVQRGIVVVPKALSLLLRHVQANGIGSAPEEGITGLKRRLELEMGYQVTHMRLVSFQGLPLTFPHGHNTVPQLSEPLFAPFGDLVDRCHVASEQLLVRFGALRVATRAPVPETAIEFIGSMGSRVVAIQFVGVATVSNTMFTSVAGMLKRVPQLMLLVRQPFHGHVRMIRMPPPACHGFRSNSVF